MRLVHGDPLARVWESHGPRISSLKKSADSAVICLAVKQLFRWLFYQLKPESGPPLITTGDRKALAPIGGSVVKMTASRDASIFTGFHAGRHATAWIFICIVWIAEHVPHAGSGGWLVRQTSELKHNGKKVIAWSFGAADETA